MAVIDDNYMKHKCLIYAKELVNSNRVIPEKFVNTFLKRATIKMAQSVGASDIAQDYYDQFFDPEARD